VLAQLCAIRFPDVAAMRQGEGIIRLQSAAAFPHLSRGRYQLLFRNAPDPVRSVDLANAPVAASNTVAVTAQRRDTYQTQLTIDYLLRARPVTSLTRGCSEASRGDGRGAGDSTLTIVGWH
jgi:hypothetical protein